MIKTANKHFTTSIKKNCLVLLSSVLLVPLTVSAQKTKKKTKAKIIYTPPVMPPEPPVDPTLGKEESNPDAQVDIDELAKVVSNFDYEEYFKNTRITDSLQKAYGILRIADSMVSVVLKEYEDTCKHKDALYTKLQLKDYDRYYQEIILNPYKGIWHVWYSFLDYLYHGAGASKRHTLPKQFPYHFEIIVNQKNGTAVLRKGIFSADYRRE